jgi:hypothetical protein
MPAGMLAYRFFAREYGWTPDQVLDLDADHIDWFMIAGEAAVNAERIRSKPAPAAKFSGGPGGFGGGGR